MTKVLQISSSILGEDSVSRELMAELVAGLGASDRIELTQRDFAREPVPHLDGAWLGALSTPEADRTEEQQQMVNYSDELIRELQDADVLVLGLPMYNFAPPSMLKAWVDHVARAGVTFKYTQEGPVGLLNQKKVYLVAAMGGEHEVGDTDFLRPYMKLIMGFIGLNDVEFVTADGLNINPERRAQGLAAARSEIERLVADYARGQAEEEAA